MVIWDVSGRTQGTAYRIQPHPHCENQPCVGTLISFLCSFLNSKSTRYSQAHLYCNAYFSLLKILKLMYDPPKPNRTLFSAVLAQYLHSQFTFARTPVQPFSSHYSPSAVGWNSLQLWKLQSTKHILLATCPFNHVNWLSQSDLNKTPAGVSHRSR